ncbi:MAG: molybdopterin molybdotransferase MoeA [Hasllibacter sp.]
MIPVEEALGRLLALVAPMPSEPVPLIKAGGRALAEPVIATRDNPPFRSAMMDGYAVRGDPAQGTAFEVVGEAAAGRRFDGRVGPGQAVRIFTGAPVPEGADRVVIQEDVTRRGDRITVGAGADVARHVRPLGADFARGDRITPGRRLTPALVALAAAFGAAAPLCARRPEVAILSTGEELVPPGAAAGPDAIFASNGYGIAALVRAAGGVPRLLPIARDDAQHLAAAVRAGAGADVLVTSGGASVGDHDLVAPTLRTLGAEIDFHKVAMRPGKPIMAGRLGRQAVLGLPGNPVSALVCARLLLVPMLARMTGLPTAEERIALPLAAPLEENGPRAHYMRARRTPQGAQTVESQDSGRLGLLASADLLIERPPRDPARQAGDTVRCLPIAL